MLQCGSHFCARAWGQQERQRERELLPVAKGKPTRGKIAGGTIDEGTIAGGTIADGSVAGGRLATL